MSRAAHRLALGRSAEALDMNASSGPTGTMPLGFKVR
jgi:hypothetical protein